MKVGKKEELSFRDLYHNVVLILGEESVQYIRGVFETEPEDNAILAYGYIDHDAGLTFEVLCSAYVDENGQYTLRSNNSKVSYKIRIGQIDETIVSLHNQHYLLFSDKINMIKNGYRSTDQIENTRDVYELDSSRHNEFPDDVLVYFIKDGIKPERIWCRLEGMTDNSFVAEILNNPYRDFGVERGMTIEFRLFNTEDELLAFAEF